MACDSGCQRAVPGRRMPQPSGGCGGDEVAYGQAAAERALPLVTRASWISVESPLSAANSCLGPQLWKRREALHTRLPGRTSIYALRHAKRLLPVIERLRFELNPSFCRHRYGGDYTWPPNNMVFPRIQVITISELLRGVRLKTPLLLLPYIQEPQSGVAAPHPGHVDRRRWAKPYCSCRHLAF